MLTSLEAEVASLQCSIEALKQMSTSDANRSASVQAAQSAPTPSEMGTLIMLIQGSTAQVEDVARVAQQNVRQLDELTASVTALSAAVQKQNRQITSLQESPGAKAYSTSSDENSSSDFRSTSDATAVETEQEQRDGDPRADNKCCRNVSRRVSGQHD